MASEKYPYNLPQWSRSGEKTSPNGKWSVTIKEAMETSMSGPTKGILQLANITIPDCNPEFIWSEDSRYLAVPQYKYLFLKRQRILIIDVEQKIVYASRKKFLLVAFKKFDDNEITGIDPAINRSHEFAINLAEALQNYEKLPLNS